MCLCFGWLTAFAQNGEMIVSVKDKHSAAVATELRRSRFTAPKSDAVSESECAEHSAKTAN